MNRGERNITDIESIRAARMEPEKTSRKKNDFKDRETTKRKAERTKQEHKTKQKK